MIEYLLQLSGNSYDDWQSENIPEIRVHEKSVKTLKVKCRYWGSFIILICVV